VSDAVAPRLEPLPPQRWGDDAIAALRGAFPESVVERFLSTAPDAPPVPNVLATMLHNPALAGPWLVYNNVILFDTAIGHRARELMVLRVAWRTRSRYEWVQHVQLAARFGIERDDIDAIAGGVDRDSWSPLERDLVAATDQLIDRYRIDDETWSRLAKHLDERQLVELVFVVGSYTCLAMAFNSFGLQVEPTIDVTGMPLPPD
jgi:alkylhydroperoxidase family enzyme